MSSALTLLHTPCNRAFSVSNGAVDCGLGVGIIVAVDEIVGGGGSAGVGIVIAVEETVGGGGSAGVGVLAGDGMSATGEVSLGAEGTWIVD